MGDFNLIYMDQDKNNRRLNRQMMTSFRRALDHMEVKEILLMCKRFTWSNDHSTPTMPRIDRMFCTVQWEELHSQPILKSLPSSVSNHCPLLLHFQEHITHPPIFKFEAHWPLMAGFAECVNQASNAQVLPT
jgi:endonuclease/exonuclease/phosphatase family metal-dependent hydrolase